MINDKGIMLSVKGNDYFISYNRIPWMKHACISDALDVKMSGRNAIEWPKLDVDLEIDSLLERFCANIHHIVVHDELNLIS